MGSAFGMELVNEHHCVFAFLLVLALWDHVTPLADLSVAKKVEP